MAWFKREKKSIEKPVPPDERSVRTEGLWEKCPACRKTLWKKDVETNLNVCPNCQHHYPIGAKARMALLLDGHWVEHDAEMASTDPLKFTGIKVYSKQLLEAQRKLGMKDAILTGEGTLNGRPVVCCAM
jgi:acetyl-CoA carboxylase carboxyl transferase subunit beta